MTEGRTSEPGPLDQNAFNTTLCVAAEELLDQHNAQGIDMDELRHRICPGVGDRPRLLPSTEQHIIHFRADVG